MRNHDRRAAIQSARAAADNAIHKLRGEVEKWKGRCHELEACLRATSDDTNELQVRLLAGVPALSALVDGRPQKHDDVLRRNVAWHADAPGIDLANAPTCVLRRAQKGPRLEARRQTVQVTKVGEPEDSVAEATTDYEDRNAIEEASTQSSEELIPATRLLELESLVPVPTLEACESAVFDAPVALSAFAAPFVPDAVTKRMKNRRAADKKWHDYRRYMKHSILFAWKMECEKTAVAMAALAQLDDFDPWDHIDLGQLSIPVQLSQLRVVGGCVLGSRKLREKRREGFWPETCGTFIPEATQIKVKGFPPHYMEIAIIRWFAKRVGPAWEKEWNVAAIRAPDLEEFAVLTFAQPSDCRVFYDRFCEALGPCIDNRGRTFPLRLRMLAALDRADPNDEEGNVNSLD